ncbi:response regulator [Deinococcus navajonensis]|uniref:Response regulator n=1 Tax=Deinococcus navajonensis TaxID=309884 RepID=A0ABV8XVM5_9DEIO
MPPAPFTLLLVEDDLADAALFQDLLLDVAPDIHVHHVGNGQEALDFLTTTGPAGAPRPGLIVLDLNMPVMNGHDFLALVKGMPGLRSIPVLVLSTSEHPQDIYQSYDQQASGYAVKPGNFQEYTQMLETVLGYWRGTLRLPSIEEVAHRVNRTT